MRFTQSVDKAGRAETGCWSARNVSNNTGRGFFMIKFVLASLALVVAAEAYAQSVSGKVNSAVGGATGSVTGGSSGGGSNPFSALNTGGGGSGSVGPGGEAGGGVGVRVGDKTVILKGAVGVEDGRSGAFRAGAGVPF